MTDDRKQPVVVGLDGSASAAAAIEFAAAEAVALGVPLRLVHGYVWPVLYACLANVPYQPSDWQPATSAVSMMDAAARRVRSAHPGLQVQTAVASGSGGAVLLDESANASLVVIGARGSGGFVGLLSGPVAGYLSGRAACPLVVVPERSAAVTSGGHACVGVDGSASSLAALRVACEWATRRRGSVEALCVVASGAAAQSGHASAQLREWVRTVTADFPELPVRSVVVRGVNPAEALLAAGRSARLIVLGAPHRGGLAGAGLGPVVRGVVKQAACPVVIAPTHIEDQPVLRTVAAAGSIAA